MTFLEELDAEVMQLADNIGVDIIIALLDKWQEDYDRGISEGTINADHMLGYYIRLKISLHHLQRHYHKHSDWSGRDPRGVDLGKKVEFLKEKTKEARRNYYVSKRRIEKEHGSGCDCRGCRCLGLFSP